ncbi:hypothetical protein BDB01DRAFT_842052 [Pilobolus umbonatus]|nr:hypothetical protein BDB01DRAFT_842052 [Pilobolus umbonatus]
MPNATLHNKLLATLPRQTLVSAERLLSPAGPKPIPPIHHQHRMTKDSELGFIHNSHPSNENRQQTDYDLSHMDTEDMDKPRHYYNTFQANDKLTKKNPHQATPSTTVSENDKVAKCSNCDTTVTPLWRRSVDDQLLCNACGLYLKLHNAPRPKNLKVGKHKDNPSEYGLNGESLAENDKDIPHTPPTKCSNCGTAKTPLWRRDIEGAPLCNACGLYLKLHNEKRPLSMKTDVIKKRQRTESLLASSQQNGPEYKKPRYYDNKDLYADSYQTSKPAFGYRNVASSLPGTGVLMMGVNSSSTS